MRKLLATLIAIGAVIPAVAFATTGPAVSGGATATTTTTVAKVEKAKCNKACKKRVAEKKRARKRAQCSSKACKSRVARKQYNKERRAFIAPYKDWLLRTRTCESGSSGSYRANTGNGFYGAYQFMVGTWQSVGGQGYPHEASPLEQDYRAVILLKRSGAGQWPVCGS